MNPFALRQRRREPVPPAIDGHVVGLDLEPLIQVCEVDLETVGAGRRDDELGGRGDRNAPQRSSLR